MDESELDELLQRAIDPYVPVELFYAVLERIGQSPAAPPDASPLPALPAATRQVQQDQPEADLDVVPLPDATMLMEQVERLEAAMAAD